MFLSVGGEGAAVRRFGRASMLVEGALIRCCCLSGFAHAFYSDSRIPAARRLSGLFDAVTLSTTDLERWNQEGEVEYTKTGLDSSTGHCCWHLSLIRLTTHSHTDATSLEKIFRRPKKTRGGKRCSLRCVYTGGPVAFVIHQPLLCWGSALHLGSYRFVPTYWRYSEGYCILGPWPATTEVVRMSNGGLQHRSSRLEKLSYLCRERIIRELSYLQRRRSS